MSKGIDISRHNGIVNFEKLKAQGLQFAIMRCGYGSDLPSQDDEQYSHNVAECERLNIPYAIYLYSYALNNDNVKSEIAHTLRLLMGKHPFAVFYDMEDADHYKANHGGYAGRQVYTDFIKRFCNAIQAAGYKAGYYVNKDWHDNHVILEQLKDFLFWYARPGVEKPDYPCDIWQNQAGSTGSPIDTDIAYMEVTQPVQPQPVPQPKPQPIQVPDYYIVQSGDTLSGIAAKFHIGGGYAALTKANGIANPNLIHPGQKIYLKGSAPQPTQHTVYVVKSGDYLGRIARDFHTSVSDLVRLNNIKNPNLIRVGQRIRIR